MIKKMIMISGCLLGGIMQAAESAATVQTESHVESLRIKIQNYCTDKKELNHTQNTEQKIIDGLYPERDILVLIDNYQSKDQNCSIGTLVRHVELYENVLGYILILDANPEYTVEAIVSQYHSNSDSNIACALHIYIAFLMRQFNWSAQEVISLLRKDYVSFLRFAQRGVSQMISKQPEGHIVYKQDFLPPHDLYDLTVHGILPFHVQSVTGVKKGFKSLVTL